MNTEILPRFERFLEKPWSEKRRIVGSRFDRLLNRVPSVVRIDPGFLWVAWQDVIHDSVLDGSFEKAERAFVQSFLVPRMVALDIGAYCGLYTLTASKKVGPKGRVIAFEPTSYQMRRLRSNLALNLAKNVTAEKLALGDAEGQSDFFVAPGGFAGFSSLRAPGAIEAPTFRTRVNVTTLDAYLSRKKVTKVDFIKIDVEGGELDVFKGASNLLRQKPRPVILCELQDLRTESWGHKAKDTAVFLQRLGFRWFRPLPNGSLARMPDDPYLYEGNFVAVPEERISEIVETTTEPEMSNWEMPYEILRKKWVEVPTTRFDRVRTTQLLELPDGALLEAWETARKDVTSGSQFAHRGWYHNLYADGMRSKKVMDVGSGFGVDSITFAQHGARLTFVDLVETNLNVLKRLCRIMNLGDVKFRVLQDLDSLRDLDTDYDVIMAMGSLHNAPQGVMKPEYQELLRHLKIGGRWLQLAYPFSRWIRDGRPPFHKWGEMTDGLGTPWCEPYDLPKLLGMFAPAQFDVVLYHEFHNCEFNWFDVLYRGTGDV
jgi:FkbM family methyltransferase